MRWSEIQAARPQPYSFMDGWITAMDLIGFAMRCQAPGVR
jgi:hypothetical protein